MLAREDTPGDKRLVAYLVSTSDQAPSADELRAFLAESLPDHMLPSATVVLDALPLNNNGKLDRPRLPEPEQTRPDLQIAYAAPTAGLEDQIAAIWREVLGLEEVGVNDNFFDLGGHSLHLIRAHGKLVADLGATLPMVDMFRFPTIRTLAHHLEGAGGDPPPGEQRGPDESEQAGAGRGRLQQLRRRRSNG